MPSRYDKDIQTSKNFIDPDTGNIIRLSGKYAKPVTYYEIKKLNTRIYMKDFMHIQMKISTSTKRLAIFWEIINSVGRNNIMERKTINIAKAVETKSELVLEVLRDMIKEGMACKYGNGKYFFNPKILTGKRQSYSETEFIQFQWYLTELEDNFVSAEELNSRIDKTGLKVEPGTFMKLEKNMILAPSGLIKLKTIHNENY